jgi:hypothetical protein
MESLQCFLRDLHLASALKYGACAFSRDAQRVQVVSAKARFQR